MGCGVSIVRSADGQALRLVAVREKGACMSSLSQTVLFPEQSQLLAWYIARYVHIYIGYIRYARWFGYNIHDLLVVPYAVRKRTYDVSYASCMTNICISN